MCVHTTCTQMPSELRGSVGSPWKRKLWVSMICSMCVLAIIIRLSTRTTAPKCHAVSPTLINILVLDFNIQERDEQTGEGTVQCHSLTLIRQPNVKGM